MNEAVNNATSIDPAHQCYITNFLVSQKKPQKKPKTVSYVCLGFSALPFRLYNSSIISLMYLR